MKPFKHYNARSVKEATKLLSKYDGKAKANAGGTDLLGAMRDKCLRVYPEAVINIKTIDGLDYIKRDKKGLRIGALAKLADIAASPEVKEEYRLLVEATHSVASPHIRNMATIGGNLAQDVRCWYYRYPTQIGGPITCLRKGGKICSALGGDNRYHSIFGAAPMIEYPCADNCPAGINMPAYLGKVRKGNLAEAAQIMMDSNPIPAVTGRICPVFCEPHCNRQEFDKPVAINCVERGVGDYILDHANDFYVMPRKESGKKVAIIGSGPAGLAAAFYLRKAGHAVTIYEKFPEAGGMLRYSIPPFRLPKDVVKKQIKALEDMGIMFKLGVNVGKDVPIKKLTDEFDAVFVAGGTWKPLKLGVPGEDAKAVTYAIDYLSKINSGEKVPLGKKVIVIGGGSVAIDVARTARRSGAEEVHLVCLECRDLTSKDRMLALDNEIVEAEEEGIVIHASLGVKEITVKDGKAVGLETVTCSSVRESDGTFNPQYDNSCTAFSLQADSIVVSIGQGIDQTLTAPGLSYGTGGRITIDEYNAVTGMTKVFAGGDIVTGAATVIQAVTSARNTVHNIGVLLGDIRTSVRDKIAKTDFSDSTLSEIPRVVFRELPVSERANNINVEDVPGASMDQIQTEASRCFNCGCLAVEPSDIAVALVALDASIVTTRRSVPAHAFFDASATNSNILEADELIKEVVIPKPAAGSIQRYEKFTLRKPIDFAIASVASVMTVHDGVCRDARIVLGAVAPEPLRAKAAEEFLKGQPIDDVTAGKAGKLALEGVVLLNKNAYKVEIAKTLVKRTLLS
jgi:NADPH-dependent glutamate synthase beta subunit-like oxidoreductase